MPTDFLFSIFFPGAMPEIHILPFTSACRAISVVFQRNFEAGASIPIFSSSIGGGARGVPKTRAMSDRSYEKNQS
jgi:hypothetical protein